MELVVGKLIKVAIMMFVMIGIYVFIITRLKNKGIQGKKLKNLKTIIHMALTVVMGFAASAILLL